MSRSALLKSALVTAVTSVCLVTLVAQTPPAQQTPQTPAAPARGQAPRVVIGPPAPVPPEVAQPTQAEITQINDELTKMIAADKSPAKALLKKYDWLLMLPPSRLNTAATYTQTAQRMGLKPVSHLAGGFGAWREAGGPVQAPETRSK